jgi:hypothetical protein
MNTDPADPDSEPWSFIVVLESKVFLRLFSLSDAGVGPELCGGPADDSRALGCGVPGADGLSRAPHTRLRCCLPQVRLKHPCLIPSYLTNSGKVPPSSVADPGSGAFLTPGPGSGIQNRYSSGSRTSDPGSQTPIFE